MDWFAAIGLLVHECVPFWDMSGGVLGLMRGAHMPQHEAS
jgi:hypothetical protein